MEYVWFSVEFKNTFEQFQKSGHTLQTCGGSDWFQLEDVMRSYVATAPDLRTQEVRRRSGESAAASAGPPRVFADGRPADKVPANHRICRRGTEHLPVLRCEPHVEESGGSGSLQTPLGDTTEGRVFPHQNLHPRPHHRDRLHYRRGVWRGDCGREKV